MSDWNWLEEFNERAWNDRDFERLYLFDLLFAGEQVSHERPDEKFDAFERGRLHAARLGEKWWEMVFEFWKIQTLLYKKQDPKAALQLAARCVVETRKPIYDGFPQKAVIHLDMVACYIRLDPIGYRAEIEAALAEIEKQIGPRSEDSRYFSQVKTRFLWSLEDPRCVGEAWNYLRAADADDSDHHTVFALTYLCGILHEFERETARQTLAELARRGLEVAREERRERLEINFLAWGAVALRMKKSGENSANANSASEATRVFELAWRLHERLAPPRNAIFGAAKAFHEEGGDLENALRVCQKAIRATSGHNLEFERVAWRWRKIELLEKLNRSAAREAKRLRRDAAKLRSRAFWEARLNASEN